MKCYVLKDLLPNYIDGLCSEEVNAEVKKHLEECADCRTACERMSAAAIKEITPGDKNPDFLKKMRASIKRNLAVVILCTGLALSGLGYIARHCEVPVPFHSEYMLTESYLAAATTDELGFVGWKDVDGLDSQKLKEVVSEGQPTIELMGLTLRGPVYADDCHISGRDIQRDGQTVKVVYYCYTETLWNRLFRHNPGGECWMRVTDGVYGNGLYGAKHTPQKQEFYYLPVGNMRRLDSLSDTEFEALKEKATLVWEGEC